MKILDTRVYRGPNLYAMTPVVRLLVDLEELEQFPTRRLGDFPQRLLALMPTLQEHTCSYSEAGGFVRRMLEDEGTWLGHVLEHVAIELQCLAGTRVSYGKTRGADLAPGHYHVIFSYLEESVGLAAAELGLRVLRHLLPADRAAHDPAPLQFQLEVDNLARLAHDRALGPSTASLVRAAEDRDIPWIRLNDQSLVQLGHGKYQQRIEATITSATRHTAVEIAGDKQLTNRILGDLGLPVPRQEVVDSPAAAIEAAERLGYPVVVKPLDGNHGKGVSIHLTTPEQVAVAYEKAFERSHAVVVETFQPGHDHRILVIAGKVVAVAQRVPGHVVGDGHRSVAQLVERVNADPRRGVGHEKVLTRLEMDHQALRLLGQAGLSLESVLPAGKVFYLRSTGNLSTGGTALDQTDVIHYDNRVMAERAVRAIGLDVGGVDFLTPDITKSYREAGGAIVEVNAAPGFRMHLAPSEGRPRDVAGPVLDMLFPPGTPARVPIAAITGTNGKTTTARMVAHILKMSGHTVGLTTTDGVYIDGVLTVRGDMTGPWASQLVLRDPAVDAAVLETARGGLLRAGLGWRKCDVGAVLNVAADHLGMGGVDDLDGLARVKQIVAEVAQKYCVLNADDERVVRMSAHTPAEPFYVTADPANELVRRHIRERGKAVVLEDGLNGQMITLYDGEVHMPLLWTHQVPSTIEGHARHNVQNAMFAAAIAHGMGVSLDNIRNGLRTFVTDFYQAPGRLNFYDEHPFRVLLDYAHNPHGMAAIASLARKLSVRGRRLALIAGSGDRRDEDIRDVGKQAAPGYDYVLVREDDDRRGRQAGDIAKLVREGLLAAGFPAERILEGPIDEVPAVDHALSLAEPGDLLVIIGDQLERTWNQIVSFGKQRSSVTREPVQPPSRMGSAAERKEASIPIGPPPAAGQARGVRVVELED
jgi:cyanophycin synthetase